mgnify:FL=1
MANNNDDVNLVTLTEPAADAIRDLMSKRNLEGYALRIFISGASCSGFQYGMALEGNVRENDYVLEQHGVQVVVDEISINYLAGATIDYIDDTEVSGFLIRNPNVITGCGCGNTPAAGRASSSNTNPCAGCH